MPDATLIEVMDAIATQLETVLVPVIPDLQVRGRMLINPTPPAVDVYPADPFQEASGFGGIDTDVYLLVRARVSPVDHEGAQDALLAMMDPGASTSVLKALMANKTLSGKCQDLNCQPPSDFGAYVEPDGRTALLGCTWTVQVTV